MTGVDIPIARLLTLFGSLLWPTASNDFNGRCVRNSREAGVVPEVLRAGSTEYKDVLLDDTFASVCFFDILNTREVANSRASVVVHIYFAVDLVKLYPAVPERATEYAYQDAINIIKKSAFNITGLVSGTESYSAFQFELEDDMQPFHLFRIETTLNYNLNNC